MNTAQSIYTPPDSEIAERAHGLYVAAGCVEGRDMDHWLEAERQLRAEHAKALSSVEASLPGRKSDRKAKSTKAQR
jgi:hypothetical protein